MSNTELWDKVCKTDPAATTRVSQRGGFTAIDAYSQIHRATEVFGPVGTGWGWEVEWDHSIAGVISADVRLWYTQDGKRSELPVSGATHLEGQPRQDSDAKKKALTDAITKGLSYLGFNADVFLGKFDDNKYVAEMKAEFHPAAETITEEQARDISTLLKDTGSDLDAFLKWVSTGARNNVAAVERIPAKAYDSCIKALERKQRDHP